MMIRTLVSAVAACALMQGAVLAQGSGSGQGTSASKPGQTASQQNPSQTAQSLPQEIKQKLQNQGFTEVQVVPGSFLVSAKDKEGDPVNMVIGPHSMMMITTADVSGQAGSGSQQGQQPGSKK